MIINSLKVVTKRLTIWTKTDTWQIANFELTRGLVGKNVGARSVSSEGRRVDSRPTPVFLSVSCSCMSSPSCAVLVKESDKNMKGITTFHRYSYIIIYIIHYKLGGISSGKCCIRMYAWCIIWLSFSIIACIWMSIIRLTLWLMLQFYFQKLLCLFFCIK